MSRTMSCARSPPVATACRSTLSNAMTATPPAVMAVTLSARRKGRETVARATARAGSLERGAELLQRLHLAPLCRRRHQNRRLHARRLPGFAAFPDLCDRALHGAI